MFSVLIVVTVLKLNLNALVRSLGLSCDSLTIAHCPTEAPIYTFCYPLTLWAFKSMASDPISVCSYDFRMTGYKNSDEIL